MNINKPKNCAWLGCAFNRLLHQAGTCVTNLRESDVTGVLIYQSIDTTTDTASLSLQYINCSIHTAGILFQRYQAPGPSASSHQISSFFIHFPSYFLRYVVYFEFVNSSSSNGCFDLNLLRYSKDVWPWCSRAASRSAVNSYHWPYGGTIAKQIQLLCQSQVKFKASPAILRVILTSMLASRQISLSLQCLSRGRRCTW
jgi:hypothetical protein